MKKKNIFNNKPILITIIAVVLLAILALFTSGERTVSWFESAIGTIVTPVQSFATTVSNAIVGFFEDVFNTTDADKENEQLKAKIAQLEVAVSQLEELKQENQRLRELLNSDELPADAQFVTAGVIANSGNIWFDMLTLNAGRNSGISEGDPVINKDGLVGVVTDVGATWCKVRSVIDAQSNISVLVERTRNNGFIRGILAPGADGDLLELYFLPSGSDLEPGDIIVTNGLGSDKIPKGITIGTVMEVMRVAGSSTNEANAIISPAVDFLHIEEVMVLTNGGN